MNFKPRKTCVEIKGKERRMDSLEVRPSFDNMINRCVGGRQTYLLAVQISAKYLLKL